MSYSSFFSSGLLAVRHSPPPSPTCPSPDSPLILPSTPSRDISDIEEDSTPTAFVYFDKSNPNGGGERPRLRKRRSSLTVATSPIAQIKSPMRNANTAVQRQNTLGNRSRSGSASDYGQSRSSGLATDGNSLIGRLRSGSVGTALRSRRVLHMPTAPPPSAPLPPLPMNLSAPPNRFIDISSPPNTPRRRPLMMRCSTMDNYDQLMSNLPILTPHVNEFSHSRVKSTTCEMDDNMMKEN